MISVGTKEHGLLFKDRMVRAIGNTKPGVWPAEATDPSLPFKWQTRRIVKPQLEEFEFVPGKKEFAFSGKICRPGYLAVGAEAFNSNSSGLVRVPHPLGTEIWVKETFNVYRPIGCELSIRNGREIPRDAQEEICLGDLDLNRCDLGARLRVVYRADGEIESMLWRSSMFMPRWASRYDLVVKSVCVERRDEISEADAIAEGFVDRADFLAYIKEINRENGKSNPWLFVYEFMRTK